LRAGPSVKGQLAFQYDSGNVWGQEVDVFIPKEAIIRQEMLSLAFYERRLDLEEGAGKIERYRFSYDGVLKQLKLTGRKALGKKCEIYLGLRGGILSTGNDLFSPLTSDQFIEWFHSAVVGGEDPFARKVLGMGEAAISYSDRNENTMEIAAGTFFISGLETAFYKYFYGQNKRVYGNAGLHLGYNISPYNYTIDFGFSGALMTNIPLSEKSVLRLGQGLNLVRKSLISLKDSQTDFGTNNYMASTETDLSFIKMKSYDRFWSLGISFYLQTPYNRRSEKDYYVPTNENRLGRWHDAASHMYRLPNVWSLYYTFGRRVTYAVYVTQDFTVNNAPDFQTGVRLSFGL